MVSYTATAKLVSFPRYLIITVHLRVTISGETSRWSSDLLVTVNGQQESIENSEVLLNCFVMTPKLESNSLSTISIFLGRWKFWWIATIFKYERSSWQPSNASRTVLCHGITEVPCMGYRRPTTLYWTSGRRHVLKPREYQCSCPTYIVSLYFNMQETSIFPLFTILNLRKKSKKNYLS